MALETIVGPLSKTIHQVELATVQTASQIIAERRDNRSLRNQSFWTADSALYRVEDGRPVLYLGKGDTNLIFRNPTEAIDQIRKTQNFRPSKEDIESVITKATRFQLSDLGLKPYDSKFAYFEINTSDYSALNPTQRAFAEQVYGTGEDFVKNINMLKEEGKTVVRVYVLNPTYVKQKTTEDSALVRACWLNVFYGNSDFVAGGRNVDNPYYVLRGVSKPTAKDDK